ncbi:MAG: DUF4430 domain-containing protein [Anaerotardibacter sp.]
MNDMKRKIAALIVALLAVVLIGASAGALLGQLEAQSADTTIEQQASEVDAQEGLSSKDSEGSNESNEATSSASASSTEQAGGQTAGAQTESFSQGGTTNNQSNSQSTDSAITVTIQVVASDVNQPFSTTKTLTLSQGATAYDALCKTGLAVASSGSSYGVYISSINGLVEKQYGKNSGWMYSVNGTTPMTACSNYVLKKGDSIKWYYVQ